MQPPASLFDGTTSRTARAANRVSTLFLKPEEIESILDGRRDSRKICR